MCVCVCTCVGKQRALIQIPGLSVGVYYSEDNIDYIIFPHSFLLVLWAFFFFNCCHFPFLLLFLLLFFKFNFIF